jgi:YHS domain-containing protein
LREPFLAKGLNKFDLCSNGDRDMFISYNYLETLYMMDPVCSMHVQENTPFISEHNGNKYYLCSEACKKSFDRDPQKYVDMAKKYGHIE